jgi:hypothetical protein
VKRSVPKPLSLAIAALTLHTASTALADDIIGEARSQKSGELLYTETYAKLDETHWKVDYTAPDGSKIASKDVDYSPSTIAPALQLRDFRNDSELRIEHDGEQLSVQTGGARERRITLEDHLVVDAGFDNFVRVSWGELTAGKSVSFPFLVAGRNSPITMSAQVTEASRCDAQSGDTVLCIEVAVKSRLISFFADPIMLSYDYDSQRLLRYHGLSNLKAADGSNQFVKISYRYPEADEAIAALPNPRPASSQ